MKSKKDIPGLYIHIPFCQRKCAYCNFYSVTSLNLIPQFISALKEEIKLYQVQFDSFDTVYIGGGTPSLLTFKQLSEIFNTLTKFYKINSDAEITLEVNPGDVSVKYLQLIRSMGINRLNIGIQSFDDKILKFLGRKHDAHEARNAIKYSRLAGFDNVGFDLIYAVHGQKIKSWKKTLEEALSFSPEHLSCYQLTLEADTPLYERYQKQKLKQPSEDMQKNYFLTTARNLENAGYIHYEVSNFARATTLKSRHNMKYWNHTPYLGLGPAAHSFLGNRRWWNVASVNNYLKRIFQGKTSEENEEILTTEQLKLEILFLGLRTKEGVDLNIYKKRFGTDLLIDKKNIIEPLVKNKLLEVKSGHLHPTLTGMVIADSLALI